VYTGKVTGITRTSNKQQSVLVQPKSFPQCNEPIEPDSKFFAKCRMVLTFDSYAETLELENQKTLRLTELEEQNNSMQGSFQDFKNENRQQIAEAIAKYTANLSPKATARFHKPIRELLDE
jgi:hypothetical protein